LAGTVLIFTSMNEFQYYHHPAYQQENQLLLRRSIQRCLE